MFLNPENTDKRITKRKKSNLMNKCTLIIKFVKVDKYEKELHLV